MSIPAPFSRVRNSEGKLFEACLDRCIAELQNFTITESCVDSSDAPDALATPTKNINTARAASSPNLPLTPAEGTKNNSPETTLPSPPPTPHRRKPSPISVSHPGPDMNRNVLHGAPPRGPGGAHSYGSQDARSNLALQPVTAPVKINLKKAAVKVVRPAGAAAVPTPSVVQSTTRASTPSLQERTVAVSQPKENVPPSTAIKVSAADERDIVDALKARALNSTPLSKPIPRVEKNEAEASLDDLFKRLTSTPPSAYPTPKSMDEEASNSRDKNIFTSEAKVLPDTPTKILEPVKSSELAKVDEPSQRDLEREYLQKARESLESLPAKEGAPVQLVKAVGAKLHRPIPLDTDVISPTNAEDLKIEYVANIVAYLNGLSKNEPKPIQADSIKKTLEQNGGDFLGLCAHLAKEKAIAIDNLDDVVGLCKAIMEVHPAEKQISHDPMDKMSSWPSQEKRDNTSGCRTVLIKGIGHLTSFNQLQSLVWGGRLESLHLPESGKDFAMIKFMTAEGCQKYFDATENGIEVPGDKAKTLIIVERQPRPNSINDVLRNCIEGDASRCVRALGADEDWSDMVLLKLARGGGKVEREVDRIKRGKNAKGHCFIEFRFANIYHALNFKRELMNEDDWEHCNIGYAPDPCEISQGVHLKDPDED